MGQQAARRASVRRTAPPADPGSTSAADVPVVGGREPCPCGSGRRYKACHGREAARATEVLVRRPFAGLASEADWVALREIVPAATAPLTPADPQAPAVTLTTLLPMAWPALRRADGSVLLGLQVPGSSGDVSRDLANALQDALAAEPGNPVAPRGLPGPGPRLQDLLNPAAPLEVTVHEGFDYWVDGVEEAGAEAAAALERANAAVIPTARLRGVDAAYWCRMRDRNHLRWAMPYDEEPLLDALARLHAGGADGLGEGTRYVGSFRAHGLLVPVWDLAADMPAEALEEPAAGYAERLGEALSATAPLTDAERRARSGLLSRQLTLR